MRCSTANNVPGSTGFQWVGSLSERITSPRPMLPDRQGAPLPGVITRGRVPMGQDFE